MQQRCTSRPISLRGPSVQGFPFDLTHALLRSEELDDLGLEKADDAFGQGVVIGVPDAADRGVDACLSQPLGVSDRQILAASIAMMDQVVGLARRALADGLVQGVEHETGGHRGRDTPADNLASEDM